MAARKSKKKKKKKKKKDQDGREEESRAKEESEITMSETQGESRAARAPGHHRARQERRDFRESLETASPSAATACRTSSMTP